MTKTQELEADGTEALIAKLEAAEAERDALLGVLRAVSDTSHRTPAGKHYQFPLEIMQLVDDAISGSKGK